MSDLPLRHRLAAVLAADMVGYTRLVERDTEGTVAAWKAAHAGVIEPAVAACRGRIVKLTGDGFLVEFAAVQDAVRCAIALQEGFAGSTLDFRIGVNLGDIVDDGRDIHGEGVNIAARIEALADAGGINISAGVFEQVRNRVEAMYEDRGEHALKHVSAPVRIYAVRSGAMRDRAAQPSSPVLPDRPSVAVMPFVNGSGDPEQGYFADGLTEDILTELARIEGLFVISRDSTFVYKGTAPRPQDACRDLGVGHLLQGSVRRAGARVRVSAQLVHGASGSYVWAERFDRPLTDIFDVQDEIAGRIVEALAVSLVDDQADRLQRVGTAVPEAYDHFLRGREQYRLFTRTGNTAARTLFEAAIALDSRYAAAHAGLAETYLHDWFAGAAGALEQGLHAALHARALDPSLPMVHEAVGNLRLFRREHDEAIAAARAWLAVEPNSADAHANLAGALQFSGEPERTVALVDKAMRLNPYYPFYYILYKGQAYFVMDRLEEARVALERSVIHNPDALPAHLYLAGCYGRIGEDALARDAFSEVLRLYPQITAGYVREYYPYRRESDLDRLIDGLERAGLGSRG